MKTTPLLTLSLLLLGCGADDKVDTAEAAGDSAAAMRLAPERAPLQYALVETTRVAPTAAPIDTDAPVLTISTDSGGDGTIDRVQQWTYDDRGNRVLMEEDRDGDGVFDVVTRVAYLYDADDHLVRIESDEGPDGTLDAIETRTYNSMGRALKMVFDTDADGTPDRIEENVWDAQGRRIQWLQDSPAGGPIEMIQDFDFQDGRASDRTLTRQLPNGTEEITSYANVFDKDGRLAAYEVDKDADGTVDNRSIRIYDSLGRLVETRIDIDADGRPDNTAIYDYDDQGRLVQISTDVGMDGISETVIYRDYHNFKPVHDCLTR